MIKHAAHYLLTDSGLLLKNGIAAADNNGTFRFIATREELIEIEQLIFHSGLMISAFEFIKEDNLSTSTGTKDLHPLFYPIINKDHLSIKEVIELARELQHVFPEMNIPDLLQKIEQVLLSNGFVKKTVPALYLLSGLDLQTLRFTERTKVKKVG
ncbi:MAG: hypothetical protein ACM3P1_13945 [Candidatus Saccharibacteria bacterium]